MIETLYTDFETLEFAFNENPCEFERAINTASKGEASEGWFSLMYPPWSN